MPHLVELLLPVSDAGGTRCHRALLGQVLREQDAEVLGE